MSVKSVHSPLHTSNVQFGSRPKAIRVITIQASSQEGSSSRLFYSRSLSTRPQVELSCDIVPVVTGFRKARVCKKFSNNWHDAF